MFKHSGAYPPCRTCTDAVMTAPSGIHAHSHAHAHAARPCSPTQQPQHQDALVYWCAYVSPHPLTLSLLLLSSMPMHTHLLCDVVAVPSNPDSTLTVVFLYAFLQCLLLVSPLLPHTLRPRCLLGFDTPCGAAAVVQAQRRASTFPTRQRSAD